MRGILMYFNYAVCSTDLTVTRASKLDRTYVWRDYTRTSGLLRQAADVLGPTMSTRPGTADIMSQLNKAQTDMSYTITHWPAAYLRLSGRSEHRRTTATGAPYPAPAAGDRATETERASEE